MKHRPLYLAPLLLAFAGCSKAEPDATAAPANPTKVVAAVKVETAPVTIQKMPKHLRLTGSVLSDRTSEVAANVAGQVVATYVERGQPVKRGQPIAVVDSKAAGFQAAAALAQSKAADTQVQLAREDCARADTLFQQGALAKSEYERQKTACSAQLYNANAAQAQADLAGKLAGDTTIRAPIDGIIGERFINIGEYVTPNARVASVFAIDQVRISISVPENAIAQVKEGQTIDVRVAAYPDRVFPAVVRLVSPALRAQTRDLIVEAFAENKDHALMPGMFATVLLTIGEEDQPTVPVQAIKADGTVRRLFLAKENSAYEMVVHTGVQKDGRIAVLEPLTESDKVILAPPPGLQDGTTIQ
jgi:membrane fusion protein (multidrug efflux system)